jgi:hypothetical protein
MKRLFTGILVILMLLSAFAPAALAAKEEPTADPTGQAVIQSNGSFNFATVENAYPRMTGTIKEIDIENSRVLIVNSENEQEILLRITDTTYVVDNTTRKSVALKNLTVGSMVYAWHSPVMTTSMPGQTNAYALVVNVAENKIPGQFFEVEKIEKTKDGYRLLNQAQDLFVNVPKNTKVAVFNSNKKVNVSTLKPGTKLLLWYEFVLESYPAQTSTKDLMMFPYDYAGYVQVENKVIKVNNSKLRAKAETDENGDALIPMQDVAKKLGFKATWNRSKQTLTLRKGSLTATFTAGAKTYQVGEQEVDATEMKIVNKKLYVPIAALHFLGNYKVATPIR